jgi:hypothetical protein
MNKEEIIEKLKILKPRSNEQAYENFTETPTLLPI